MFELTIAIAVLGLALIAMFFMRKDYHDNERYYD